MSIPWSESRFSLPCHFLVILILTLGVKIKSAFAHPYAVDRRPEITGQQPLSTNEEQAITIKLADLKVKDDDDWFYPWGFTLKVYEGSNYTLSGTTVTPNKDFAGTLTVPVTVNDGEQDSKKYDLVITVINLNDAPVITGQQSVSTNEDVAIVLQPSHLYLIDPDDTNFTLSASAGTNYSVSGTTITPASNFSGTLSIPVKISDGKATSNEYAFKLEVKPVNDAPQITGQQALTTNSGVPLTLQFSNLTVSDADNTYPTGFTIILVAGDNYTASGNQITPSAGFSGTLTVGVKVSDGTNESNVFNLSISVVKGNSTPVINGQTAALINEDESFDLTLAHLKVTDADNTYPQGFTMTLSPGSNYSLTGNTVKPSANYYGNLQVPVRVSDGQNSSEPYNFIVTARPINDPPAITISSDSILYPLGKGAVAIFNGLSITDTDNDSLALAEAGFLPGSYEPGKDLITFTSTPKIKGVFDSQKGILALIGKASLAEYTTALTSIKFDYITQEQGTVQKNKKAIYLVVNDGQAASNRAEKKIRIITANLTLDIPTAFTPNGDFVNDTWGVKSLMQSQEELKKATLSIYTKSGKLVFQSNLLKEWDGRFNGTLLPADVYFYTIDLNTQFGQPLIKGIVTILR